MITEDISSNICPCFSIKDVCKLLLYNTSSSSKSVLSDLAKHREQDCVSILTIFFTILLLILAQFRSWTIANKEVTTKGLMTPILSLHSRYTKPMWRPSPDRLQMFAKIQCWMSLTAAMTWSRCQEGCSREVLSEIKIKIDKAKKLSQEVKPGSQHIQLQKVQK